MAPEKEVDLLVVGGGINGAGIARDAAGRGLDVLLCERDDLASHTSSWSTKLVHGGLRYLEHYEFRLVRESLMEREVLLDAAPHLVRPLRFVLPHHSGLRPAWMLRLGLFLYDNIGGRKMLPPTKTVDLTEGPLGAPLKDVFKRGFEYTDCAVDDARLVAVNALDAEEKGAEIRTRTALISGRREAGRWVLTLEGEGGREEVRAKAVANAAGPWVTSLFDGLDGVAARKKIRLVKGSHIVTTQRFSHDRAYIFQNSDNRIIFAIPYLDGQTLIGTTDEPYGGDPAKAEISEGEIDYLLSSASEYFKTPVRREDIASTYSGVRPLYDDLSKEDASAVTRDYAFDIEGEEGEAALLSVYGGKLTTYRKLAEHALKSLAPHLPPMGPAWTKGAALPGGEGGYRAWPDVKAEMKARYGFLAGEALDRMLKAYGTRLVQVLGEARGADDLGPYFGHGLYAREVEYLCKEEFALTAKDVLFRRSKLGLRFDEGQEAALASYLSGRNENAAGS